MYDACLTNIGWACCLSHSRGSVLLQVHLLLSVLTDSSPQPQFHNVAAKP